MVVACVASAALGAGAAATTVARLNETRPPAGDACADARRTAGVARTEVEAQDGVLRAAKNPATPDYRDSHERYRRAVVAYVGVLDRYPDCFTPSEHGSAAILSDGVARS